jgi:c-di-GMP-binding flagellar brake protein YcgR
MKKIYRIEIQDGENIYYEYSIDNDTDRYKGFLRDVKNVTELEVTNEEYRVLEKLRII